MPYNMISQLVKSYILFDPLAASRSALQDFGVRTIVCLFLFSTIPSMAFGEQIGADPHCAFRNVTDTVCNLQFGRWSAQVGVLGRNAELVRSQIWPGFTNLLVAEIDSGTAGSYVQSRSLDVYVFDVGGTNTTPLLVQTVKVTTIYVDQGLGEQVTNCFEDPYTLGSTNGFPMVEWTKTGQATVLTSYKHSLETL